MAELTERFGGLKGSLEGIRLEDGADGSLSGDALAKTRPGTD